MEAQIIILNLLTIFVMIATATILSRRYESNVGLFLSLFFIYFWSIHGSWGILDVENRDGGYGFHYLFDKLFTVQPDRVYLMAIGYYCLFIVIFCLALIAIPIRGVHAPRLPRYLIRLRLRTLVIAIGILLLLAVSRLYGAFSRSLSENVAFYSLAGEAAGWSSGKKFLEAAITLTYLSLALLASQKSAQLIAFERRPGALSGLVLVGLAAAVTLMAALVGSKSMLLSAVVSGLVFYQLNKGAEGGRILLRLFMIGLVGAVIMALVNVTRGLSVDKLAEAFSAEGLRKAAQLLLFSNEAFGAHFSMYGVLLKDLQPSPGIAAYFLVGTLLPFDPGYALPSTYEYYATGVDADPNQGYSIHYATGAYLNFGILGIVFGAVLMAICFAKLFQVSQLGFRSRNRLVQSFVIFGFALFVANVPLLLRGGLEAYRAMAITMLFPLIALAVSMRVWRILWQPRDGAAE